MKTVADAWTPEALDAFLTNPKGVVAGTKMSFAGLPKAEDRANIIKFLEATP
jgi:cytochrome c